MYKIESYIIRDKDKIPVFRKPYNTTNQLVSVGIRIAEEFNKNLYSFRGGTFGEKVSDDKSKELTYLKSITGEKVQVPKSPETVKQESTYPFDKIREMPPSEQKAVIEQLYKLIPEQNQKSECQSTNQKKLEKPFLRTVRQKQSITRKMVTKKEEDNTDKKLENKTTEKSKNNEVFNNH